MKSRLYGATAGLIQPMTRRKAIKLAFGGAAMGLAAPALSQSLSDKILIGVPSSLSTPYGVADDTDHLNGTTLALEEINASGGVLGRELELFVPDVDKLSPESARQAIAACIDKKVMAISNAFLFAPIPAMDESAKYKCPYLQGNTQRNATEAYKANDPKWIEKIRQHTRGDGPDVLLEMSGNAGAIDDGFKALRMGGTAALLGIPSRAIAFDLSSHVIFKGATVLGVNGRRMFETWYQMEELLLSGRLELDEIVTHQIPFADFAKGFGLMQSGEGIKIVMNVGD